MILTKETLKTLSRNKLIFAIDANYGQSLQKVIINAMEDFAGVPIEWEDIYNEFLAECHTIIQDYDDEYAISTFLNAKCRFFAKNKCRVFLGTKYALMNNYVEQLETIALQDPKGVTIPIDLSSLNRIEMKVYEGAILDELPLAEIARRLGISKFKITNIYESILRKLKPQVEKN